MYSSFKLALFFKLKRIRVKVNDVCDTVITSFDVDRLIVGHSFVFYVCARMYVCVGFRPGRCTERTELCFIIYTLQNKVLIIPKVLPVSSCNLVQTTGGFVPRYTRTCSTCRYLGREGVCRRSKESNDEYNTRCGVDKELYNVKKTVKTYWEHNQVRT